MFETEAVLLWPSREKTDFSGKGHQAEQGGRQPEKRECEYEMDRLFKTVASNLGPPDVLGLQLPEILASRGGGEGFWEL